MQNRVVGIIVLGMFVAAGSLAHAGFPQTPVTKCAVDAVVSGTVCMDKYEASVWRIPDPLVTNKKLVTKVKKGTAKVADLTAAGATQLGIGSDNYAPCADNGQTDCTDIYAVSLQGVLPSRYITWFQAQEACANAGKRLPTSAEWQVAANGTPDGAPCTVSSGSVATTGAAAGCVSARGAYDMVGNLDEWMADWVPRSTACTGWGGFSDDYMCLSGASPAANSPGALVRGGDFNDGAEAGPLSVSGTAEPSMSISFTVGFRCAR